MRRMSMKVRVREIAERLGLENPHQLHRLTGIPINTAYALWEDTWVAIGRDTLDRLCTNLQTHPGLLLEFVPDPRERPAGPKLSEVVGQKRGPKKGSKRFPGGKSSRNR